MASTPSPLLLIFVNNPPAVVMQVQPPPPFSTLPLARGTLSIHVQQARTRLAPHPGGSGT